MHNTVSYCRDNDSTDLKIISILYKLDFVLSYTLLQILRAITGSVPTNYEHTCRK